ncbi:pitrilysin family protein [Roseofilum sp. BLCC_M91]|uniref:Pitrilysin family protein n=1 Tax=Roseofilum halophilum BLCC-M91 TaxID=3022259 RepID=A0ABT7BRF6_9CYAN|nr:pitrilysin family protein [Roseofilum halophilum]MDJ1181071.1 pitrilysin family protein [Roseofilum halophilum BLCC-M91]
MTASLLCSLQSNQTHRLQLTNGIVLLVVENPITDIVSSRWFLRSGCSCDPPEKAGIANLVSSLLTKGTPNFSWSDIAEQIESVGASCGADAAADYFLMSLKTVSGDFVPLFKLVAELMRSPTFPLEQIQLEKRLVLQSIRQSQEQPFSLAFKGLREAMYGDHPYGKSPLGTLETVETITQNDLQAFHQAYFRPDNLVISICGRITVSEAVSLVEDILGDWQAPEKPIPQAPFPQFNLDRRFGLSPIIQPQETQQSIVMVGYPGAPVKSPDYPVLKLLNTYLGNGLSSRLFVELREKRGLAYDVSAFYPTRQDLSQFVVYMGTAPSNTDIAIHSLQEEVERLSQMSLTLEELTTNKNKLLGQYALGKQTNSQIAHILGWYETIGLGIEFDSHFQEAIAQVSIEQAQDISQTYLTSGCLSIVGPQEVVGERQPGF